MISDDELAKARSLPKMEAFSSLEHAANDQFESAQRRAGQNERADFEVSDYAETVAALAEACEISQLVEFNLFAKSRGNDYGGACWEFRRLARIVSQRFRFAAALGPENDPNLVRLDPATKQVIRFHLQQIKATVDNLNVSDQKRRRLYSAINKLEAEIDKDRTPLAAVIDMVAEACEGAEPILEIARKLANILRDAKQEETARLPQPQEQKRLEPPKAVKAEKLPKRKGGFDMALDDEIPF